MLGRAERGEVAVKMPPDSAAFLQERLLAFRVLALLVSNAAAGLASRLAGSLALAASAVLCAIAKVLSLNGSDVFHSTPP